MNIFFDARWTRMDTHDGVSRYGACLLAALAKLHPVTMLIYDKRQLKLLPKDVPHVIVNSPFSLKELFLPRKLNKLGADVVFSPLQVMGSWGRRYKLIVTLHDLIYYQNPKPPTFLPTIVRLLWWLYHKTYWPQRFLLNRADFVATVSQTSADLIKQYRLTNRPVGVVYNAPTQMPTPATAHVKKQLIYMGSFMPYKNVELLLHAMPQLPEFHLHLASRISSQRRTELEKIIENPTQVTFWNGATDAQYAELLSEAAALVSASKAEGFGLPLIEAMSQGTPVVCSDLPIFREVARDAALFFDPDSVDELVTAVQRLNDSKSRSQLVKKGLRQAQTFSWDKSAAALLKIMKDLAR